MSETLHHLILWAAAADALCSLFHTGRKYPIIDKFEYSTFYHSFILNVTALICTAPQRRLLLNIKIYCHYRDL